MAGVVLSSSGSDSLTGSATRAFLRGTPISLLGRFPFLGFLVLGGATSSFFCTSGWFALCAKSEEGSEERLRLNLGLSVVKEEADVLVKPVVFERVRRCITYSK